MTRFCRNPDCNKPIPDNRFYCDEICLEWDIKHRNQHSNFGYQLKPSLHNAPPPEALNIIFQTKCYECKKPLSLDSEDYYAYHGHKFCNRNCCIEFKKHEEYCGINWNNKLEFMEYVHQKQQQQKEVLVYEVEL